MLYIPTFRVYTPRQILQIIPKRLLWTNAEMSVWDRSTLWTTQAHRRLHKPLPLLKRQILEHFKHADHQTIEDDGFRDLVDVPTSSRRPPVGPGLFVITGISELVADLKGGDCGGEARCQIPL